MHIALTEAHFAATMTKTHRLLVSSSLLPFTYNLVSIKYNEAGNTTPAPISYPYLTQMRHNSYHYSPSQA